MKQFSDVNSRYGAPMGRAEFGTHEQADGKIRLFKVRLDSGGYDDGGAYWGSGQALFCATDGGDFRQFIRADSRLQAVAVLGLEYGKLKRPPLSEFLRLCNLESRGVISAGGVKLLQQLEYLGFRK